MQQAFSLLDLIKRLREGDPEHLSFGMFTGYTLAELDAGRFHTFEDRRTQLERGDRFALISISR